MRQPVAYRTATLNSRTTKNAALLRLHQIQLLLLTAGCWYWLAIFGSSTTHGFSARLSPSRARTIILRADCRSAVCDDHCHDDDDDDIGRRTLATVRPEKKKERITTTTQIASSGNLSRSTFLASFLLALPTAADAVAEVDAGGPMTTTDPDKNHPTSSSNDQPQQRILGAQQESISGFVAGAALAATKTLVKYPLDTATVRLQMPSSPYSVRQPQPLFEGSYRGVVPPLLANIPAGAVFFAVKDAVKAYLTAVHPESSRWQQTAIAVGVAQIPYWMVRNPSEVVKTRQQAGMEGYNNAGMWQAYRQVYASGISTRTQLPPSSSSSGRLALSGWPPEVMTVAADGPADS